MSEVSCTVGNSSISVQVSLGVGSSTVYGGGWVTRSGMHLETYPRVGNKWDGIAGPGKAIEVAEFGFYRLKGEKERPVKVLSKVVCESKI